MPTTTGAIMNRYLFFDRIILACGLIVAVSVSTARCQFYDPLGVQNKSKPFGKYGPTFQYTSPTKVMNVLSGRSNKRSSQRVARRVTPTRAIRLDILSLSVSKPSGQWVEADLKETGSTARYMISRNDPTIIISLAGERSGPEMNHTDSALLAESQAKIKSLGGIIEPGKQQLSAGRINGVTYSATIVNGKFTTYYAMWVAAHNGYNYKLAVYGDKHDKSMIDAAMRNFVHGIQSIQSTAVAHRNSQKTTITR
jgi:hypothetical protein